MPVAVHWGDMKTYGDVLLNAQRDVPEKSSLAPVTGQTYAEMDRPQDRWFDLAAGGNVLFLRPAGANEAAPQNIHEYQEPMPGLKMDQWQYETLKRLAMSFGTYYGLDEEGRLHPGGTVRPGQGLLADDVLGSNAVGDHRGLVFIDTLDQEPPREDNLGTVTIMASIVLAALFFAGAPLRHILGLVGLGVGGAVMFALTGASRSDRISAWLNGCTPEQLEDVCWQPMHGMWALGSGGVFGVGLGSSALKWSWLPHAESDYIFAIIGEELGLIGAMVVLVLFAVLAIGMVRLMRAHTDPFRRIATGAVLVWILGQAFVNVAVVLGMLPVLGVPLRLMSAGGTALVATLIAIGVVLSLARDVRPGLPS